MKVLIAALVLGVVCYSQGFSLRETLGCPNTDGIFGICVFDPTKNCLQQQQCPTGYSCCPYGCGLQCLATTDSSQHPGTCPTDPTPLSTAATCTQDITCQNHEKCCGGHCVAVRASSVPVLFIRH